MESPITPPDNSMGKAIRHLHHADDKGRHLSVLFQRYGSVWPSVLPYCILNMMWTILIWNLKNTYGIDLTSSNTGHQFMGSLAAFLIVTRLKLLYDHYMFNAQQLANLYKSIRELAQYCCILTIRDKSPQAQQWRHDVLYHAIVLLRVTMAVLEFKSNPGENIPWDVPELSWEQQLLVKETVFLKQCSVDKDREQAANQTLKLAHTTIPKEDEDSITLNDLLAERTVLDEACRTPNVLALRLRSIILQQKGNPKMWEHPCNEETKLLDCVGDFLKAFASLQVIMTTPMPFPLVQMTKTFLFVWVFSIPFAVCHYPYRLENVCILVFLITYGFFGLEIASMELADVFGDDPCDFDNLAEAQFTFEDLYICLYKIDGEVAARKLRQSVKGRAYQAEYVSVQRQIAHDKMDQEEKKEDPYGTLGTDERIDVKRSTKQRVGGAFKGVKKLFRGQRSTKR